MAILPGPLATSNAACLLVLSLGAGQSLTLPAIADTATEAPATPAAAVDQQLDEIDLTALFLNDDAPNGKLDDRPNDKSDSLAANALDAPMDEAVMDVSGWPDEPRVVIHSAARSQPLAGFFMGELARSSGLTLEQREVDVDVADSHLRYFHARDKPQTVELARRLGTASAPIRIKDFTHFRPKPHRGLIEVWVEGVAESP